MARTKRRQPYDPSAHDRRATDLLRNAQVAPIEVDDPMERGGKLLVMRSTRDDPLADLHARGQIDEAQYQGGRSFQEDFETAERGPRAIDPSKEAVDGGLMPEPITEAQRKAARSWLSYTDGSALAHDGQTLPQISRARGFCGRKWEDHFSTEIKFQLNQLAFCYKFTNEKPQR
jgi:hypothetical protein